MQVIQKRSLAEENDPLQDQAEVDQNDVVYRMKRRVNRRVLERLTVNPYSRSSLVKCTLFCSLYLPDSRGYLVAPAGSAAANAVRTARQQTVARFLSCQQECMATAGGKPQAQLCKLCVKGGREVLNFYKPLQRCEHTLQGLEDSVMCRYMPQRECFVFC